MKPTMGSVSLAIAASPNHDRRRRTRQEAAYDYRSGRLGQREPEFRRGFPA
jgi:hypothetical protein